MPGYLPLCQPVVIINLVGTSNTTNMLRTVFDTSCETLLIGDSIVCGLSRYKKIWDKYFFNSALNLGIGGDMLQHVLWRIRNTRLSKNIKFIVAHCGTNNVHHHQPDDIVDAMTLIAEKIHLYNPNVIVILSGFLPRDSNNHYRDKIALINFKLKIKCTTKPKVYYLEHGTDWTNDDGTLKTNLFFNDNLHLIEHGNEKLSKEITNIIQKIRNNTDLVDSSTYTHLPHLSSHISHLTHATPIGKANIVKIPKWEECEYVHTPYRTIIINFFNTFTIFIPNITTIFTTIYSSSDIITNFTSTIFTNTTFSNTNTTFSNTNTTFSNTNTTFSNTNTIFTNTNTIFSNTNNTFNINSAKVIIAVFNIFIIPANFNIS